jgi:hypothetical protein
VIEAAAVEAAPEPSPAAIPEHVLPLAAVLAAFGSAIEGTSWAADLVDVGTTALVGAEYASGIGEAKLIYDGVTYVGAVGGCLAGVIHFESYGRSKSVVAASSVFPSRSAHHGVAHSSSQSRLGHHRSGRERKREDDQEAAA